MDQNEDKLMKEELINSLQVSRYNTSLKMVALIEKMQIRGLWVMYK
jgi:hypothetical protein